MWNICLCNGKSLNHFYPSGPFLAAVLKTFSTWTFWMNALHCLWEKPRIRLEPLHICSESTRRHRFIPWFKKVFHHAENPSLQHHPMTFSLSKTKNTPQIWALRLVSNPTHVCSFFPGYFVGTAVWPIVSQKLLNDIGYSKAMGLMSIVQIINVIAGLMYYESDEHNSPNGNVLHAPAFHLCNRRSILEHLTKNFGFLMFWWGHRQSFCFCMRN